MSKKFRNGTSMAFKHQFLNTYIHNYKDKLSLPAEDDPNEIDAVNTNCTITIDFKELYKLRQAS